MYTAITQKIHIAGKKDCLRDIRRFFNTMIMAWKLKQDFNKFKAGKDWRVLNSPEDLDK